jgi:ATP-dependent DNA helicase DinG
VIEAEVHLSLRQFIREQGEPQWQHHLTMARLVARALRLGRSALMQTGSLKYQYLLSYLTPALLWQEPVIIAAPPSIQRRLLDIEIPRLQEWLDTQKKVIQGDTLPDNFHGVLLTSTSSWLADRLHHQNRFPQGVPTIIDYADDLESLTRQQLTITIRSKDWDELLQQFPAQGEAIRNLRVQLTKAIFTRPSNPYNCYLLAAPEQRYLGQLWQILTPIWEQNPTPDNPFWQFGHKWQQPGQLFWAEVQRHTGRLTLYCAPVEVATVLQPIWEKQPVVLIGGFLDSEATADVYRQQVGLGELTCLKFSPDRQDKQIRLYTPDRLPLPNTPEFQSALIQNILTLISLSSGQQQPIVILVGDVPLKAQVGTRMAAEFGSRVKVEQTELATNSILVSGWEFWRTHGENLPTPHLLIIATLPLPSLEHPVVAGRVAYYKQAHKDWFRLYLLPTALREIQRAVVPVSPSQGVVALLDNRVNHRSYGRKILGALEPFARTNYLTPDWFDSQS